MLGFYPVVAVRDVEVLSGVVCAGKIVVHGDGHGHFVLHIAVTCGCCGSVSIEQIGEVHAVHDAIPPLALRDK